MVGDPIIVAWCVLGPGAWWLRGNGRAFRGKVRASSEADRQIMSTAKNQRKLNDQRLKPVGSSSTVETVFL
jgi:hypothetical protein